MLRIIKPIFVVIFLILGQNGFAQTNYGGTPPLNPNVPFYGSPQGSVGPTYNLPLPPSQPGVFNTNVPQGNTSLTNTNNYVAPQTGPNSFNSIPSTSSGDTKTGIGPGTTGDGDTSPVAPRGNNYSCPPGTLVCNVSGGADPCQAALQREAMSCAIQSAGGNALQNMANTATNSANSACTGQIGSAIAGMGAAAISLTSCPAAHANCSSSCATAPNPQLQGIYQQGLQSCNGTFGAWKTGMALTLGITGVGLDQALQCANGTNTNDPAFQNPTYNPTNVAADPAPYAGGQNPYTQAAAQYETPTGGNSGTGAPPAPYPGGAAGAGGGKDGGAFKDVALGTSNSAGGGGFPGNTVGGGGWPTGQKNEDGVDLAALLQCQLKGGKDCRAPASVPGANELSKAEGMTNFQKITKKMNEKRPNFKDGTRS